jgi:hypothetical protein
LAINPVVVPVPEGTSDFVFAFGVYKGDDLLVEDVDQKRTLLFLFNISLATYVVSEPFSLSAV